jgi:hypothetical protein
MYSMTKWKNIKFVKKTASRRCLISIPWGASLGVSHCPAIMVGEFMPMGKAWKLKIFAL